MEPFSQIMAAARQGGYAVAYFEPWDEASLLAILRGAERARAPIMIGQSGLYLPPALGMDQRFFPAYAQAGRLAAEAATVPVAYLFNETPYWDWAVAALPLGFNVVMYSNPTDDPEAHVSKTADLVRQAAAVGVEVESEVGSLLGGDHDNTEPEVAADFARRTGVHALGITAGNRHLTTGKYQLDLDLIARLAEVVPAPLVLHGGSGAEDEQLREAAGRGVPQVNYGTAQRLVFLAQLERSLAENWRAEDPHELLGTGLEADVMRPALEAVSNLVAEKCEVLGAAGQA